MLSEYVEKSNLGTDWSGDAVLQQIAISSSSNRGGLLLLVTPTFSILKISLRFLPIVRLICRFGQSSSLFLSGPNDKHFLSRVIFL